MKLVGSLATSSLGSAGGITLSCKLILFVLLLPPWCAGPAVISKDAKGKTVFKGTVLEGINGKSLDKRLQDDASFCDVDFILLMLKQVQHCSTMEWLLNSMVPAECRSC